MRWPNRCGSKTYCWFRGIRIVDRASGAHRSPTRSGCAARPPISHVAETAIARAKAHSSAANGGEAAGHQLSLALVSYGRTVEIVTPEPQDDSRKIDAAVGRLSAALDDVPLTFTAISQAADHFLPYRKQGYELLLVVVANNAGDDWEQYDVALARCGGRVGAVVFGIGDAVVPFIRRVHFSEEQKEAERPLNVPCESCDLEQIDLGLPGGERDTDLTDSGYGPFGLERLCRATEGEFLRLVAQLRWSRSWRLGRVSWSTPELLRRYAPDYVSPAQYQQLLGANKARPWALGNNVAQLPSAVALGKNVTAVCRWTSSRGKTKPIWPGASAWPSGRRPRRARMSIASTTPWPPAMRTARS